MATRGTDLLQRQPMMPAQRIVPAAASGSIALILPAILLFYSALLPSEARLSVAGFAVYPPRLMGVALLPFVLNRLVRDPFRLNFCDIAVLASAAWMTIAFVAYYGAETGFARGFALSFDVVAPYWVARTCIRNLTDFRRFLVCAAPGFVLVGLTMLAEVLAGGPRACKCASIVSLLRSS